jgi:hypothetical protein
LRELRLAGITSSTTGRTIEDAAELNADAEGTAGRPRPNAPIWSSWSTTAVRHPGAPIIERHRRATQTIMINAPIAWDWRLPPARPGRPLAPPRLRLPDCPTAPAQYRAAKRLEAIASMSSRGLHTRRA